MNRAGSSEPASFAGHGIVVGGDRWMAGRPAASTPQAEAVEIEIDHRRRIKCQHLAYDQPADDRDAEWTAQLRALAERRCKRDSTEQRGHRGHHDRSKPEQTCLIDGFAR